MSDYETDVVDWSEQQAARLRRVAAGERVNAVDWPKVIEEIESLGREQLRAVESLLLQALVHELEATAWPASPYGPHWRAESRNFRAPASLRFAASMRWRLDLEALCARALRILPESVDGQPPLPVPSVCPFTRDELRDGV